MAIIRPFAPGQYAGADYQQAQVDVVGSSVRHQRADFEH